MSKRLSRSIIRWYQANKRELPWREESDPYRIWLSEIILQQTQVAQGLQYYLRFISRYPSVKDLALASEDEILKDWQGLGYYSRARNLHFAAKTIHNEHGGSFPRSFKEIKALKGVGEYTAAAVASFAFGLPHAVVDGNVYRLLSRFFNLSVPIDSSAGKKRFAGLAASELDEKQPALHNQAIMEFGSQYCRPVRPDCPNCVLSAKCGAFKAGTVDLLPVKEKRTAVKKRFFNYLVLADHKRNIFLNRREAKDIWQGLYEFKLIETEQEVTAEQLLSTEEVKELCANDFAVRYVSGSYTHVLTHQQLHSKFYVITKGSGFSSEQLSTSIAGLDKFAFPRLIEKFLTDCDLKEIL